MIDEALALEASLDGLLIIWHTWASGEQVGQAYPSSAPGCALYRASRQYDTENGAMDGDVDSAIGAAVDAAVQKMENPYRTAIHINARNLVIKVSVWGSARLPVDPVERAKIMATARDQLRRRLQSDGLL